MSDLAGGAIPSPLSSGPAWPRFAAIVAVVVLAAGGGLLVARTLSSSGPSGYLDSSSSLALFVQMTRNGGRLAGTISGAYISPSDPGQVQTAHSSFTGIASGSSVTLTFGSRGCPTWRGFWVTAPGS